MCRSLCQAHQQLECLQQMISFTLDIRFQTTILAEKTKWFGFHNQGSQECGDILRSAQIGLQVFSDTKTGMQRVGDSRWTQEPGAYTHAWWRNNQECLFSQQRICAASLNSLTRVCLLVQVHDTRKDSFSPLVCFYLDQVENPWAGWWWHWWDWWGRRQSPIVQTLPAFPMCCCCLLPTTYTLESRCLMRETEEQRLEQLTLRMEGSLMMPRVVCAKKGLFLILGENRLISKSTQVCKSCKGK